jgi:hypothetical protein
MSVLARQIPSALKAVLGEYAAWARRQRRARDATLPLYFAELRAKINRVIDLITSAP